MNKNIVLFDLDQTLFDFRLSESEALSKTLIKFGITPSSEMIDYYSRVNDSQWKLLEKGLLTREEVLVRRFEIFFEGIGVKADPLAVRYEYERNLSKSVIYIEGAKDLFEVLKDIYRLFIVSNGTAKVQNSRIGISGIDKYFEKIFISENIGYNKPDKRFFDKCFEEIPLIDKENTVIVGDSLSSDILGGKNAGIKTVWYNPSSAIPDGTITSDYEITSLDMLPIVLEMIFSKNED